MGTRRRPSDSMGAGPRRRPPPFLLPHLRSGMRLLDVGCGPGSITRGLAERVAPGEVIGLDTSADVLVAARQDALARGLTNLQYQHGSVYELPYPDASFDATYAHQVLPHLADPRAALAEMVRVLRREGLCRAAVDLTDG